jgi:DNA-binding transcriptional LysR family regulator
MRLIDAAIDGQGIALARTALVAADLIDGRLIRPFRIALPLKNTYWIVCPKVTSRLPKIVGLASGRGRYRYAAARGPSRNCRLRLRSMAQRVA